MIGVGGIGKRHIRSALENSQVELAALADVDQASVHAAAEQLHVPGFTDYRDMLGKGLVDAVSIATPHHLHAIMGLDCLKAGAHVFIEKPLANSVSEADALLDMARSRNRKICVGHQYRTYRLSQTMKSLIDSGVIGRVMRVLWTWGQFRTERYYEHSPWRAAFRHVGGGVLVNHASHDVDLICWMIGRPAQVSAFVGVQLHKAEVEDVVCANVLFENGALASLQFTINQPRGYSVRQVAGDRGIIVVQDVKSLTADRNERILLGTYEDDLATMVVGLTGIMDEPGVSWRHLRLPGDRTFLRKLMDPKAVLGRVGLMKRKRPQNRHSVLMDSFINAIIQDEEPIVSGESARTAVELMNAMYLSALRKKVVDLPIDPEEYDQLLLELSQGKTQAPRFLQPVQTLSRQ